MEKVYSFLTLLIVALTMNAQDIQLLPPDTTRGLTIMKALMQRASTHEFNPTEMKLQDLSDLLWAANGINRPDQGKKTAPSAMNTQEVDIYVFLSKGVYIYNAKKQLLEFKIAGDNRILVAGPQEFVMDAPVMLVSVADIAKFRFGEEEQRKLMATLDAGIVSQNISIFCAAVGFYNRPRGSMNKAELRKLLQLSESQYLMMNNVVSYATE